MSRMIRRSNSEALCTFLRLAAPVANGRRVPNQRAKKKKTKKKQKITKKTKKRMKIEVHRNLSFRLWVIVAIRTAPLDCVPSP